MSRPLTPKPGGLLRRVRLGIALSFALGCSRAPEPASGAAHPNVVLISLDTTRADHLGCYGSDVRTPNLDRLAAEAIVFTQATTPAPTTLSAHTSLFTGTYPRTHGVVRNGFRVHADNVLLAERLGAAGYRTIGVLGSFALSEKFGVAQGFDVFDESFDVASDGALHDQSQRRASAVTDAALACVDGTTGEAGPVFLFAHYFDAHSPYEPPGELVHAYTDVAEPPRGDLADLERTIAAHQARVVGEPLNQVLENGLKKPYVSAFEADAMPGDRARAAQYAGEITYMDGEVGRLLDGLGARGILDDALVIVTADHGETFWEHPDVWNHGLALYGTTTHVPLIVRLPDGRSGGARVDHPVSLVDVVPTVLEIAGLATDGRVEGVSLLDVAASPGVDSQRAVFSEATQPRAPRFEREAWGNGPKAKAVRMGRWKYVWTPYMRYEELFDLAEDPDEARNLLGDASVDVAAERDLLRARLDAWIETGDPMPSAFEADEDGENARRLGALGYGGAGDDSDD